MQLGVGGLSSSPIFRWGGPWLAALHHDYFILQPIQTAGLGSRCRKGQDDWSERYASSFTIESFRRPFLPPAATFQHGRRLPGALSTPLGHSRSSNPPRARHTVRVLEHYFGGGTGGCVEDGTQPLPRPWNENFFWFSHGLWVLWRVSRKTFSF